jgi:hypothetical protein
MYRCQVFGVKNWTMVHAFFGKIHADEAALEE